MDKCIYHQVQVAILYPEDSTKQVEMRLVCSHCKTEEIFIIHTSHIVPLWQTMLLVMAQRGVNPLSIEPAEGLKSFEGTDEELRKMMWHSKRPD